ncbi:LysM peptidoglycan-binding domain-containing M23 family metallopeptidase [Prosthecomicrobium pneumaticum]|uniref:Murein DD-endopeptidase MepM/ murein hydrolase activator NlpD n=1 Tax=Prosthecomicrobium pneumaticum TaxID=81895 RepID=A0A7W9L3I4_9HYPH|nr:LysM peptidoglycan-binding domain-containing M23 family metallopeptidase [Prosthecomicrobium pneumaticum]MBB5754582.1 murein DD-endopeptidase MepM/ murein hydrolase activator NlpD [Prosthecomicrobium pneumaticum]
MRSEVTIFRAQTLSQVAAVALLAGLLGACSADGSRFRGPAFTATTDNQRTIIGGAGQPMPPVLASNDDDIAAPSAPPVVARGTLPPPMLPSGRSVAAQPDQSPYRPAPVAVAEVARPAPLAPARTESAGTTVTIGSGDTLSALSRRYGVPVAEIVRANGISDPGSVRIGQRLVIPGGGSDRGPVVASAEPAALPPRGGERGGRQPEMRLASGPVPAAERDRPAPLASADAPAGVHTVSAGQTLGTIARLYNVSVADLVKANGLSSPNGLRSGQKLRIPGHAPEPSAVALRAEPARREDRPRGEDPEGRDRLASASPSAREQAPARVAAAVPPAEPEIVASAEAGRPAVRVVGPKTVEPPQGETPSASIARPATPAGAEQTVAYAPAKQPDAPAATVDTADPGSANGTTFRWPVRGRIISGFGGSTGGERNDGINLAVPEGTSVKAAEAGTVIYAGSELEGYGKLVLVRHADGWVSAYAHNSDILVKRGDTVRRGQIISRAGATGSVTQPQLHFELRRGSRPVNPLDYLSGA